MAKRTEKQIFELFDRAIETYKGDTRELARLIGQYAIARRMGWKPFLLMTDKRTFKQMEQTLGIDPREDFPEVGDLAHRSVAWKAASVVSNFWKAVKGEIPGVRSPELK